MSNDFESAWKSFTDPIKPLGNYSLPIKDLAEYFFNAGVASTKRKPEQIPALFKPKYEPTD